MISLKNCSKITALIVGGILLNIVLLIGAEALLEKQFSLGQKLLAAKASPAASEAFLDAFHTKDMWADFIVVPVIGCVIGIYAGILQKRGPAALAIACLAPELLYEVISEPVRTWPAGLDIRYFGMRLVELLLAAGLAIFLSAARKKEERKTRGAPAEHTAA